MASSKDCMHEEVCNIFSGDLNEDGAEKCVCFKDRNRFVELPCKVGDTVFVVNGFKEIEEFEVDYYVVEKM